ncbi:MAG: UbiA family prenyltransferase [Bacteroidota bacterium]
MNPFQKIVFYLKVSRPGLWFATIWLYLLPVGQMEQIWQQPVFWLGLFYVCFPLNFLVYGWNDWADQEIDQLNPRKGNFLFGAKGTAQQLKGIAWAIGLVQLLLYPVFVWLAGPKMLLLLLGLLLINAVYNWPERGLRTRPPFELICQFGYLLVVPFSMWLNNAPELSWYTYLYLSLFAMQSHLMGEVMDVHPDKAGGRRTTATEIGIKKTKLLIIFIVMAEVSLLFFVFQDSIFGGMLLLGLLWLLLDLFLIFKTQRYTLAQMKLFGYGSNGVAFLSMAYVWYSGCLLI